MANTSTQRPPTVAEAKAERDARMTHTVGLSQGQLIRKRFFGHRGAMVSLGLLTLIIFLVFTSVGFGPIPGWWKYRYDEIMDTVNGGAPTITGPFSWGDHPFGQDRVGHDMFAMTMRGAQQSIIVMVLVGLIACTIGATVGAAAGYFRGWTEAILMRLTDMVIIIPLLILAAVLGQMAGNGGAVLLSVFLGCAIWTGLARLVRGEFLTLREREFVDAARIAGASDARIIAKHIMPNAIGVLIVNTTLLMSEAILLESALSYLGLGVRPPDVSLGQLISNNQEAFTTRPWLFWWPGLFIVVICLCINFIGDGLRDAFDPRQRKFSARKAVPVPHPEADILDDYVLPPLEVTEGMSPTPGVARNLTEEPPARPKGDDGPATR